MSFNIRECTAEDGPAIQCLNRLRMGYDFPLKQTTEKIKKALSDQSQKIFVAEANGQILGYVHIQDYDVLYAPHMKNILGIAVSPQHQRQGVGRALLHTAEKWAIDNGAAGVRLVSGDNRKNAHKFYAECGYDGGKKQINLKKMF